MAAAAPSRALLAPAFTASWSRGICQGPGHAKGVGEEASEAVGEEIELGLADKSMQECGCLQLRLAGVSQGGFQLRLTLNPLGEVWLLLCKVFPQDDANPTGHRVLSSEQTSSWNTEVLRSTDLN